jgi:hypothetical protein
MQFSAFPRFCHDKLRNDCDTIATSLAELWTSLTAIGQANAQRIKDCDNEKLNAKVVVLPNGDRGFWSTIGILGRICQARLCS